MKRLAAHLLLCASEATTAIMKCETKKSDESESWKNLKAMNWWKERWNASGDDEERKKWEEKNGKV